MIAARPYREGDKVRLKEAGTVMTVVVSSDNLAFCEWTERGARQHQVFRHAQLEHVEPPQLQQPPSSPPSQPQS